jgi:hypothetical protein
MVSDSVACVWRCGVLKCLRLELIFGHLASALSAAICVFEKIYTVATTLLVNDIDKVSKF